MTTTMMNQIIVMRKISRKRVMLGFLAVIILIRAIRYEPYTWGGTEERSFPSSSSSKTMIYDVVGPERSTKYCHRKCHPAIQNRIVYTCLHPAGLLDRQELLDHLVEISAFLCATLEFPVPASSFHPMHNHQQSVEPTLQWTDFFNYSLVEQSTSATPNIDYSDRIPLLESVRLNIDPSFYIPTALLSKRQGRQSAVKPRQCRRPRAAPHRNKEKYGLHVISFTKDDVLNDFDIVRIYSFNGSTDDQEKQQHSQPQKYLPFLWEIPTNYYTFHKEFKHHLKALPKRTIANNTMGSSCIPWTGSGRYVQRQFPSVVQQMIHGIWKNVTTTIITANHVGQNSTTISSIGFLHIRRGDTIEECDTSISKLRSYLTCSFTKNMTYVPPPRMEILSSEQKRMQITLLVGTNEEDRSYNRDLQHMIDALSLSTTLHRQRYQLNVKMIDMESMIWNYMKNQVLSGKIPKSYMNNLHVFQISDYIMNHLVDFKLVQRRFRYCNPCDKIVIRLK